MYFVMKRCDSVHDYFKEACAHVHRCLTKYHMYTHTQSGFADKIVTKTNNFKLTNMHYQQRKFVPNHKDEIKEESNMN